MQHLPAEQQRFEEFYLWSRKNKGRGGNIPARLSEKHPNGDYVHDPVQRHWWTWQMAMAPDRLQVEMSKND